MPAVDPGADERPSDNAGDAEGGDDEADDERRAAKFSDVERQGRLQNEVVRVAEKLRGAEERE